MTPEKFRDALDGLFAYDTGSTDSGIHDEDLRERCVKKLAKLSPAEITALTCEMWLSEEARAAGYGEEDAEEFLTWLIDRMGCAR